MSTNAKIITGIVIVIVVVGGAIWYWNANETNTANNSLGYGNPTSTVTTTQQTTTTTAAMPQGDSDQAIEQDMTAANAQMDGFSSDSASIDQGMNDKPVEQGQ
jgi:hypothetical protein